VICFIDILSFHVKRYSLRLPVPLAYLILKTTPHILAEKRNGVQWRIPARDYLVPAQHATHTPLRKRRIAAIEQRLAHVERVVARDGAGG
jgi:hypothetical protein